MSPWQLPPWQSFAVCRGDLGGLIRTLDQGGIRIRA